MVGMLRACEIAILFLHFVVTILSPESLGFTLKLIQWDSPESPLYQPNLNQTQKVEMMAISSKARAVKVKDNTSNVPGIQIPMEQLQDLNYAVKIKIGEPETEVTLLLSTGSGWIWTWCKIGRSKTYKSLSCAHEVCRKNLYNRNCECIWPDKCVCILDDYGIPKAQIFLSSDTFTLPTKNKSLTTFKNMVFGCTRLPRGKLISGYLGLNNNPASFIQQLSSKSSVGGRFSYCLHGGEGGGGGYLSFGNDIPTQLGKGEKITRTYTINRRSGISLALQLIDISVSKQRVYLSPYIIRNNRGITIDTGCKYTVLMKGAYDTVIKTFENYYKRVLKKVVDPTRVFKLCYKHNQWVKTNASMTYHLGGWADYETRQVFVETAPGIMCVGLLSGDISILGANQQWNKRFIFNMKEPQLRFSDQDCARATG